MATYDDKTGGVDAVENASNNSDRGVPQGGNVDDQIIYDLQHQGEEVGFTFRSLMAAAVRMSSQVFCTLMLTKSKSMGMCYNAYLFTLLIPPAILSFINADLGPDPTFTWITGSWNLGGAIFVSEFQHASQRSISNEWLTLGSSRWWSHV
jgi:hypothetical protein